MPDRYIRDELLSSARFWSVSSQAQVLFLACMLLADDAARLSAAPLALRLRGMAGTVDDARLGELLRELTHADLVRTYSVAGRGDFLFIPRFRQRKRYVAGSKHPPPPKEISDIDDKSQTQVRPRSDLSQTQVYAQAREGLGLGLGFLSLPLPPLFHRRHPPRPQNQQGENIPKSTAPPAGGKPTPASWPTPSNSAWHPCRAKPTPRSKPASSPSPSAPLDSRPRSGAPSASRSPPRKSSPEIRVAIFQNLRPPKRNLRGHATHPSQRLG